MHHQQLHHRYHLHHQEHHGRQISTSGAQPKTSSSTEDLRRLLETKFPVSEPVSSQGFVIAEIMGQGMSSTYHVGGKELRV